MPRTRRTDRVNRKSATKTDLLIENEVLRSRVKALEKENAGLTELLNRDPASVMRVYGRNGRVPRGDQERIDARQPAW